MMLTVTELRRKAEKYFPRYLGELVLGTAAFPWEVTGTLPGSGERLTELLYTEMPRLRELAHPQRPDGFVLETDTTALRRASGFGQQTWPRRVVFASARELLAFLGSKYRQQARQFTEAAQLLRRELPTLPAAWLAREWELLLRYPPAEWAELAAVARYFLQATSNGPPPLYVRELPVAVHTKFVEEHEAGLAALLRELLPGYLDPAGKSLAARLRLREPESLVYVRVLDSQLQAALPFGLDELMVPVSRFRQLDLPGRTVLITENKVNFLTLPPLAGTLAVWGSGYAVERVATAPWLPAREVFYWGDLDFDGFQILHRLRRHVPTTRSLLMDEATFQQHAAFGVARPALAAPPPLAHLTPAEHALYEHLARHGLRLEQERITQATLLAALRSDHPHLLP